MGVNNNGSGQTKADLLLSQVENLTQQNRTLDAKVEQLARQNQTVAAQIAQQSNSVSANVSKIAQASEEMGRHVAAISAQNKVAQGKMDALTAQSKTIDAKVQEVIEQAVDRDMDREAIMLKMEADKKELAKDISNLAQQLQAYQDAAKNVLPSGDIDELAAKIAENMYIPAAVAQELDYDVLAEKVAEKLNLEKLELDYDALADKVAAKIAIPKATIENLDYDALARKLAEGTPAEEVISADYIASKVAEQLMNPVIDESAVAERVAQKIGEKLEVNMDDGEIADRIAKQVGTISPEQFDVMVDEDGCDSLAKAVEGKLDYEVLSSAVAEKIAAAGLGTDIDSEEIARLVAEKLNIGQINEDVLADKAAAVLSNYLPDIDTDELAEKVASAISPAQVDSEAIALAVATKMLEGQADKDYDIVLDEDGIDKICDAVAQKLSAEFASDRNVVIDEDGADAVTQIVAGQFAESISNIERDVAQIRDSAPAGEYDKRLGEIQKQLDEIKAMLAAGAIISAASDELAPAEAAAEEEAPAAEDELVTVSGVVEEEPEPESNDEEDGADEEEEGDVIDEIVEDIDENPSAGEIMPDGIPGISSSGVDFANMMKYNRSFIARIIQATDEQKRYYGEVKNSLLAYKKVNSNISWGAERFNKGRETIARFKIRGKTLCLYLALDPNEFATSVYHHTDVSDNKSMHGTPMMVKIKSPRGAKKAIRLVDIMLEKRGGVKREITPRDYAAMYPYETIEELIEEGLVKDVSKK